MSFHQFAYTLLVALVACVSLARATDLETSFCGCAGNQCCVLTDIDFFVTQTFSTGQTGGHVETIEYGNFTVAYAEADVVNNNFNFFSLAPIDCTQSMGLLFEQNGAAELVVSKTLIQANPNNCLLNFSTLVSEADLRKPLDLVLAFAGMPDQTVNVVVLEPIVPYTTPTHTWVVEETQGDDSIVSTSLNILVHAHSGHNESCLEAANVEHVFFQFLPGGNAPFTMAQCRFSIDTMNVNAAERIVRIDYALLQSEYQGCYRQDPESVGQDIVYTMEVRPEIGGCDYYETYATYIFTITLDSQLSVNTTAGANSLVIDYLDDTLTLLPCGAELNGANPLVPLARLDFVVEVNTAYGTEAISIALTEKTLSEIALHIIGSANYSSLPGGNTKARFRLRTSECLFVETAHAAQPATQANLIGCSVNYLQPMDIEALATYTDGFTESNDLRGNERNVLFTSSSPQECAGIVVPVSDVTQEYGATLIVEDYNGRSDSLNLNNPIVVRVELANTDLAVTSGVSVVLNDVVVTLTAETSGTVYRRTYTQADKIEQMQLDVSPYEEDGHFCRIYDTNTRSCDRFYRQTSIAADYATNHWNAYLQNLFDVGTTGFFVSDGSGRKYRGCQDLAVSAADSFIFTPADWIFDEFPENTGTMAFEVTAYLRACDGTPARFLRLSTETHSSSSRERHLQDDLEDVAIVFNNVTIVNSQIVIGGTGNIFGTGAMPVVEAIGIGIGSGLGAVAVAGAAYSCASGGAVRQLYSRSREAVENKVSPS